MLKRVKEGKEEEILQVAQIFQNNFISPHDHVETTMYGELRLGQHIELVN